MINKPYLKIYFLSIINMDNQNTIKVNKTSENNLKAVSKYQKKNPEKCRENAEIITSDWNKTLSVMKNIY